MGFAFLLFLGMVMIIYGGMNDMGCIIIGSIDVVSFVYGTWSIATLL